MCGDVQVLGVTVWFCADGVFVEQCACSLLLCGGVQVLGITMWWCAGAEVCRYQVLRCAGNRCHLCCGLQVVDVNVCL